MRGIHRLHARVERVEEVPVALVAINPAGLKVGVCLALPLLPLARPEPCLIRVVCDLLQQDGSAIHGAVRQPVDELM